MSDLLRLVAALMLFACGGDGVGIDDAASDVVDTTDLSLDLGRPPDGSPDIAFDQPSVPDAGGSVVDEVDTGRVDANADANPETGGEDARGAEVCIVLSAAELGAAGSDGVWSPGEAATVMVTMSNTCSESFSDYPGAHLETETAGVSVSSGDQQLYGILPDQPVDLEWTVEADAELEAGTVAKFTASVTSLGCEERREGCPPPAPYAFEFVLDEPITAPTDCLRFADFALRHYIAEETSTWEPGVRVAAEVVMSNHCDEAIWTYPAARLSADARAVAIVEPLYVLYGIVPGDGAAMAWAVTADPALERGTDVTFTVVATTLNCDGDRPSPDCPSANPFSMTRTLGGELDPRE